MIRFLMPFVAAVITLGCIDNRSPIPVTELPESKQLQAAVDVSTVSENERYDNPVDDKTYVAPEGWKEYQPSVARMAEGNARIRNDGVRLLTAPDEISRRISGGSLVAFIKRAEASAQAALIDVTEEVTIIVQFDCSPEGHDVKIVSQDNVTQSQLQSLYGALFVLESMPVKSGELSFQLTIQVEPAN